MMNTESKYFKVMKIILILALLAGIIGFVISEIVLPNETDSVEYACEEFDPQWTQVKEDGSKTPVDVPGRLETDGEGKVVIETEITSRLALAGYLAIRSERQDINIYVGDKLRASYSTKNTRPYGRSSASYYVFAKFYSNDEGKVLRVEYETNTRYAGLVEEMYYGTQTGIWMKFIKSDGVEMFIGVIMVLLALLSIFAGIFIRIMHKGAMFRGGDIIYLGIGILLAGMWVVFRSPFRQMMYSNISSASDMTFFALMLMPIPFLIYMNEVQEYRYKKLYSVIIAATVLDTLVCMILQFTNLVDFHRSVFAMFALIGITILSFIITNIIDVVKKRINRYSLIAVGLAGVCISGVVQMVTYINQYMTFGGIPLCIGFIFMLAMAVIRLIKNAVNSENEKLEAQRANKMQEEFLANMSHEIRTPLNAIIGLNEMIMKETSESHIKEYSSDIKGASKALLGLINDILDFSRIEAGKVDITPVKYWTAFLLTDSYNLIAGRAEEKGIEVKVEADPRTPEQLYGDETRVRQIVTNLLTNAVKYTNEGRITLKLHWRKNSIETALIRISIEDTGVGISEEDQEKLFRSFQRVDEKRNRNIEGTGLGLVICKQLVELMGGRIWVKSKLGEGSEFFVEFPQMIVSEHGMGEFTPKATQIEDAIAEHIATFTAPEAKILVVDDVETNLKVMKNLLKDTYIRIETATSGQECLDLTETNGYDVIFLDHRMPEMDGVETLHHMRERVDDINQETPIIMLTANVVAGARENYLSEGFTDYITKPIRQAELKQMLLDYLPIHKILRNDDPNPRILG
ncbi:MAG: response regulator [Eubacterium sp.]|nr:response regulator [Eubacterium sp.]